MSARAVSSRNGQAGMRLTLYILLYLAAFVLLMVGATSLDAFAHWLGDVPPAATPAVSVTASSSLVP